MTGNDLTAHAHALLDTNRYLTIGTTDADGRPWTTPVYFAPAPGWQFYWMSETDTRHSRNIIERPEVSLLVFDSAVPPRHGRALYGLGTARELTADEVDSALQTYPGPSHRGATPTTRAEVTGSSSYRLYRATADELWVLCPREPGQACPLHGLARDHRTQVR